MLYGLHEPGGESLMPDGGYIVFTHGLGHDPANRTGHDYRPWSKYDIIARLNHDYKPGGTVPMADLYPAFAQRVANFVAASQGCRIWIIGNEPNHSQERPGGVPILAADYALCFRLCQVKIHALPGHESDQVCVAAVAPWNVETGDWIEYFTTVLTLTNPDAIALHAYTHGSDPALITSQQKMDPPYQDRFYHFQAYRQFMAAIPERLRKVPVYITECDQNVPWADVNSGWVQNAYQEIDNWNQDAAHQAILALVLYRWPKYDQWYIVGKVGVQEDFRAAVAKGYGEQKEMWSRSQLRAFIREEMRNYP